MDENAKKDFLKPEAEQRKSKGMNSEVQEMVVKYRILARSLLMTWLIC